MTQTQREYRYIYAKRRKKRRRIRRIRNFMILFFTVSAICAGITAGVTARRGISAEHTAIPLLLQTDSRWKDIPYGGSTIGISGCGPVCLSMTASAITGNTELSPDFVAAFSEENGYYVSGVGTSWDLMTDGARQIGLKVKELALDEELIKKELNKGHPIICSMLPGDFTNEGHFIVLTAYKDGMIYLNDPNSEANSSKEWSYETLKTQIGAMWVYK